MAPLKWDNLDAIKQLQNACEIRHVPIGYLSTTIIDDRELFQFKNAPFQKGTDDLFCFEDTLYSNDFEFIEKTKKMLDYLWQTSQPTTSIGLELVSTTSTNSAEILPENYPTRRIISSKVSEIKNLTEEEVLNKIIQGKQFKVKDATKDINRIYGSGGSVIIHPPSFLNLPDLMLEFMHAEKQSSLGAADTLTVYQYFKTDMSIGFAPVGWIINNKKVVYFAKKMLGNNPLANNVNLVREEEINIQMHGNRVFIGWTVPIKLLGVNISLPPACVILESYGNLHSVGYTLLTGRFNAYKL